MSTKREWTEIPEQKTISVFGKEFSVGVGNKYVVVDRNGEVHAYEGKPRSHTFCWVDVCGGDYNYLGYIKLLPEDNWEEMIYEI